MSSSIGTHIRSNVVGYVAVFLALGGVSYAAGLQPDSVRSKHIVDGQVKSADLGDGAVIASKVAPDSLGGGQIDEAGLAGSYRLPQSCNNGQVAKSNGAGAWNCAADASLPAAESWHEVAAGSNTANRCTDANLTGVFCSVAIPTQGFFPWENWGAGYSTAAFYKDQLGNIHLKGLVGRGARGLQRTDIFRLPVNYRPTTIRVFPSVGSTSFGTTDRSVAVAAGRVDVLPNGLVQFLQDCTDAHDQCSADGADVTLEGISFRPDG